MKNKYAYWLLVAVLVAVLVLTLLSKDSRCDSQVTIAGIELGNKRISCEVSR